MRRTRPTRRVTAARRIAKAEPPRLFPIRNGFAKSNEIEPPLRKDGGFFLLQHGFDVWNFGGRVAPYKGWNKKLFRYRPSF